MKTSRISRLCSYQVSRIQKNLQIMARCLFGLIIAAFATATVIAQGPKPEIIVNTVTITIDPDNPYFQNWEGIIAPGGQILSVHMPVLEDLPENTMMAVKIDLSGQVVLDFESSVCDALDDESFGKEIVKYSEPKGQFPEECPFIKGENFKIDNYEIPQDKLPQNTQPGPFHAEVKLYTVSIDNPEVFLVADGEIVLK